MNLHDYAAFYVRLMDGSEGYGEQYKCLVTRLEKFTGRPLAPADLTESLVNDYLASIRDLGGSTRKWRRNALLRLWRHAATNPALKERPEPPNSDLITRVKTRQKSPRAWSIEEVRQLLAASERWRGHGYYAEFTDSAVLYSKRLYWRSYILAAWSLGWRRCDLMSLEKDWIPKSGRLSITQQKTGKITIGQLHPEAIEAIEGWWQRGTVDADSLQPVDPDRRLIWPQWCNLGTWYRTQAVLIRRAGLDGSIGKLRHSSGTNVESHHPGSGPTHLGNTPQVFYSRYFDRTQVELPSPEPLTED